MTYIPDVSRTAGPAVQVIVRLMPMIIDQSRLLGRTGFATMSEFSHYYADSMDAALATGRIERQA